MSTENPDPLAKVDLSSEEMVIGNFKVRSIDAPRAWSAAVQAQTRAHFGFNLLRSVRPNVAGEPMVVSERREDMPYKAAALARRLMDVAVAYELPILVQDIERELGIGFIED